MKNTLFTCLFLSAIAASTHAQSVYAVDYESQADEDGLWYMTDYESQADVSIYYVDYQSQADLTIYYVDYESQAGWNGSNKSHLFR